MKSTSFAACIAVAVAIYAMIGFGMVEDHPIPLGLLFVALIVTAWHAHHKALTPARVRAI